MNKQDANLQMEITSRHAPVSDDTKDYCTRKASKLLRFNDRISRIQIVMDRLKEERVLEMIVHVDSGATLVAKETARGYKAGIDLLMEKMERQLRREKEKRKSHKGEESLRVQSPVDPPIDPSGDDEDI